MIVSELITELQKYPPEMRVVGRGYENGYDDLRDVSVEELRYVPDGPWYDGEYQERNSFDKEKYDFTDILTIS